MSDAVPVKNVLENPVPMLRAFDWVATALESFRERPLPGSYGTNIEPVFDVFGTSRVGEMQFESIDGGVGNIEALLSQVPAGRFRQYVSLAFQHDDAASATHVIQPVRVIDFQGSFPFCPLADPARSGAAPDGQWFTIRGVTCPPGGRVGALITGTLSAGTQIFLRSQFVEFRVGETFGGVS